MFSVMQAIAKAHEFFVTMMKVGFSEKIMEFLTHNEEVAKKVVEFAKTLYHPAYKVVLDCTKTIVQMVAEGSHDWSNANINDKNFPAVGAGTTKPEITLFHFDRLISSKDAIAEMKKEGYRPANVAEILALGKAHPDLQREFPIVALGQTWQNPNGYLVVVCLCENDSKRGASLVYFGGDWVGGWRFAAVREEKLAA